MGQGCARFPVFCMIIIVILASLLGVSIAKTKVSQSIASTNDNHTDIIDESTRLNSSH